MANTNQQQYASFQIFIYLNPVQNRVMSDIRDHCKLKPGYLQVMLNRYKQLGFIVPKSQETVDNMFQIALVQPSGSRDSIYLNTWMSYFDAQVEMIKYKDLKSGTCFKCFNQVLMYVFHQADPFFAVTLAKRVRELLPPHLRTALDIDGDIYILQQRCTNLDAGYQSD